jgi:formyl-CoA transferase
MKHGGETMREVKKHLAEMPTAVVVERMAAREVPCAPVVALDELRTQPQVVAAGVLQEIDHDALGRIVQPRPAAALAGMPLIGTAAPNAGEHTDEVLAEIGYSPADIDELRRAAVVH